MYSEARRLVLLLFTVAVVGLLVPACGSSSTETGSTIAAPVDLDGEFATLNGGTFDLATLEGQDVVLWFWAPW